MGGGGKPPGKGRKEYSVLGPDEWGPIFLLKYSKCGSLTRAATSAGVARDTVYKRRRDDPEFAAAMEEAKEYYRDSLIGEIDERGNSGALKETVVTKEDADGNVTTTVTRTLEKSDTLLIFQAKAWMPEMYGDRLRVEQANIDDLVTEVAARQNLPPEVIALSVERIARGLMDKQKKERA